MCDVCGVGDWKGDETFARTGPQEDWRGRVGRFVVVEWGETRGARGARGTKGGRGRIGLDSKKRLGKTLRETRDSPRAFSSLQFCPVDGVSESLTDLNNDLFVSFFPLRRKEKKEKKKGDCLVFVPCCMFVCRVEK